MKKIFITLLIVISLSFLLSEQETVLGTSVELIVILGFIILSATFRSFATNLFGYNRLIKVPMKNQNGKKILLVGEVHLYNGAETREVKKLIKPYRKIFHEVGKIGIPKSDPNFKKPLVYKVFKIILRFYYFFLKSIFIPTESPGEIAKKNNQPVIGLETEQTRIQDIGLDGLEHSV